MNKQQAIERLKGIVDFYKLNDENNYDYSDEVLISMRIALEEIERLNKVRKFDVEYNKNLQKEIIRLNNIIKEVKEYIEDRYDGEVLTHTFDKDNVGELLNILKGVDKE